jgi:hypothetical protein
MAGSLATSPAGFVIEVDDRQEETDVKRWLQALLWAGVAVLLVAELVDGVKSAGRRLTQVVDARWARFERRERTEARRSQIAALASRIEGRRAQP